MMQTVAINSATVDRCRTFFAWHGDNRYKFVANASNKFRYDSVFYALLCWAKTAKRFAYGDAVAGDRLTGESTFGNTPTPFLRRMSVSLRHRNPTSNG
jgi:hypothetical protein